ncbi:MAG: efflux RND transporter periplasmic adaptor subunit [Vicinamibacteria bacterium]|nr:efflux RND transporter periplasmic adaptor subunit [Vicinamibacteria bacterium]
MSRRTCRLALAVSAPVLGLALAACGSKPDAQKPAAAAPAALPDDVRAVAAAVAPGAAAAAVAEKAASAAEASSLQLSGEFDSPMRSKLVVRWPGRVHKVLVDEGTVVRAGQPLLELEKEYLVLDVQRAEAELARARSAQAEAAADFQRKRDLLAKGSVPRALHDRSQAAAEQTAAQVQGAEASLGAVRQRLADAVLVAPFAGVIAQRHVAVGEHLSDATPAFVLVQTAPLKLRVRVPERYLASVKTGLEVKAAVDPFPGETFDGTVSVVSRSVDPQSRTFLVEALFANRDGRLSPGLFARVAVSGLGE